MSCSCSRSSERSDEEEQEKLKERKEHRKRHGGHRRHQGHRTHKKHERLSSEEDTEGDTITNSIEHYAKLCVSRKTNLKVYKNKKLIYKYIANSKKDCETIFL